MIELQHITVDYGDGPVLQDLSLSFPPGQLTVLLGPNGCGKSTLLKAALNLLPHESGRVLLDGADITLLSPREVARKAAYLAQSRSIPNITVRRMVLHGRFPYLSYPRHYRPEDYEAVQQALAQVDAADLSDRSMAKLSGGQRQKVYLAMALAQDTQSIFMDEPTTYLDVKHQLEVMSIAQRLARRGKAVVLVLHDLGLALRSADRVALLEQGRLVRVGTPEEIYASGDLSAVFGVRVLRVETADGFQYYCQFCQGV